METNKSTPATPADEKLAELMRRCFGFTWQFTQNQREYAQSVASLALTTDEPTDDQLTELFNRHIGNAWAFTGPQRMYARAIVKLTREGDAAAKVATAPDFNFSIDPPGNAPRIKRWKNGSCEPATAEECAMWDVLQARMWPEGAAFTDGEGGYFDEQADPLVPAGPLAMSNDFRRGVPARPLAYSLEDYWHAPTGTGPLGLTWKDKPHRVVYDLLAALRFYSDRGPGAKAPQ